jgi:hypothetical protein
MRIALPLLIGAAIVAFHVYAAWSYLFTALNAAL